MDSYITEAYFDWLKNDTFVVASERREFEGVLRVLHDIPFTWLIHSDDNRAGDAMSIRQSDFLDFLALPRDTDQVKLGQWATSTPSVLEVLLGCARRWGYYFGGPSVPYYFNIMFRNMGFQQFPGRTLNRQQQELVRDRVDNWLTRQFMPSGLGSPWPLNQFHNEVFDQRSTDMWGQMNAYSAEHFQ